MSDRFDENKEFDEVSNDNNNSQPGSGDEKEYAYKSVMRNKENSRTFSLVSLILSIISIVCCCTPWISLLLSVLAVVFAVFSRKNLGYFDGLSIAGLVVGIFGCVFAFMTLLSDLIFFKDSSLSQELEKYLEEILGDNYINYQNGNMF